MKVQRVVKKPLLEADIFFMNSGEAGASARREHERRKDAREKRVKDRFGRASGLILAVTSEPQSENAWKVGAVGEEAVAKALNSLVGDGVHVLHDRRIPKSKANIDHIVVSSAGVMIVDAKNYRGKIEVTRSSLRVAGRNQIKLIDSLERQCKLVQACLGDDIPVNGSLCFVKGDFAVLRTKKVREFRVTGPRTLTKVIGECHQSETCRIADVHTIAEKIANEFVAA